MKRKLKSVASPPKYSVMVAVGGIAVHGAARVTNRARLGVGVRSAALLAASNSSES